jgi:hypothetical protein
VLELSAKLPYDSLQCVDVDSVESVSTWGDLIDELESEEGSSEMWTSRSHISNQHEARLLT